MSSPEDEAAGGRAGLLCVGWLGASGGSSSSTSPNIVLIRWYLLGLADGERGRLNRTRGGIDSLELSESAGTVAPSSIARMPSPHAWQAPLHPVVTHIHAKTIGGSLGFYLGLGLPRVPGWIPKVPKSF